MLPTLVPMFFKVFVFLQDFRKKIRVNLGVNPLLDAKFWGMEKYFQSRMQTIL